MSLNALGVTDAIAALDVDAVTIYSSTNIPLTVKTTDCPLLMPMLNNWIVSASGSPAAETTFGTPSARMWMVHRVYRYVYLHKQLLGGRAIDTKYSDAVENIEALWTAVSALDVANVDIENITHGEVSTLQDKAGNSFVGCLFDITITERINP